MNKYHWTASVLAGVTAGVYMDVAHPSVSFFAQMTISALVVITTFVGISAVRSRDIW